MAREVAPTNQWKEKIGGGVGGVAPGRFIESPSGFASPASEGVVYAHVLEDPLHAGFVTLGDLPVESAFLIAHPDFAGFISPSDAGPATAELSESDNFDGFLTPDDAGDADAVLADHPSFSGFVMPVTEDADGRLLIVGGAHGIITD